MAIYTDPVTGRRTESETVAPAKTNVWGIATLVLVLAVLGWFAYGTLTLPPADTTVVPQPNVTESAPAPQPANPLPPSTNTAPEPQPAAPTTP